MKNLMTSTLVLVGLFGCSSGPASRALSGQVDTSQVQVTSAQIVARSAGGRVFHAPIAPDGSFKLSLPVNERYSIRFANATTDPKFFDVFSVLTSTRANGLRTHWYTLTPGNDISLGRISRTTAAVGATAPSATTSGTLGYASESDDVAEYEDDEVEACDIDDGQDQIEVESEHDLLDDVDSDRDGTADSIDAEDDRDECTAGNVSDDCETDDAEEQELDDDFDAPCADGGGSPVPAPPAPVPGGVY